MSKRARLGCMVALLCGLLLAVSACGGGSSGGGTEGGSAEGTPAKPSEVSGHLTVWDVFYKLFPEYTKAVKPLDEAFEKKFPNVTVEHVAQGFEQYPALVQAAFTAREGPDVMMMLPSYSGVLNYTAGLEELNGKITPEMKEQLSYWYTMTPGYEEEGPHYGVPIGSTEFIFYYNKKLFKKAGLPTTFEPKTWDEVREAGEKLKAAGIQPFVGGDKEGYEDQWWWMLGWPTVNTKQQSIELGEGEIPFTSEEFAKAWGPEEMMEKAGLLQKSRFTTPFFTEGYEQFSEGKGGMILGGSTTTAYWGEFNKALGEENVGMFYSPGAEYVTAGPEFGWSIPKFAPNKAASWAYIEFMASKPAMELLYEKGGLLPNRKDVKLPADAPRQAKEVVELYENNETFDDVAHLIPNTVAAQLSKEAPEYFQGRISMEDMQKSLQEKFEKEKK
ncbi:MAG: extracellular solute-binding protein [Actinobacteria bacterium]|nr:extracellular solute-binding protein [Actinomycetota bacterium]